MRVGYGLSDRRARLSPISPAPYRGGGEFRGFWKPANPVFGDFGEFRGKRTSSAGRPRRDDRLVRWQVDAMLTSDQDSEIVARLAAIGETDQAIVAEVLTLCRHDDDARAYYLVRAGYAVTDDDRRCCWQCSNLRSGVCFVARPGGLVPANRGYRPASPGVLQRCAGYAPNANDTDQRPGCERWPGLAKEGNA